MFSWTVSLPFAILHVDLWIPGNYTDNNGNIALMNTMCGIIHFVVVIPVPDESSITLASYFMQHVLMKFGLCHLIVLDDSTPFKEDLIAIYQALNLNYNILAKLNHTGFSVDIFHRFLNKSVIITAGECGTKNIFVPTGIAADYT